jgi:biopolymer transport protein ExbB/TolQ
VTLLAIVFMLTALGLVTALAAWCYYKVLSRRD